MKTIVIAAQKGGAGKTTLARDLAVAAAQDGRTVLCLDLDPKGSLRASWESREADTPAMLDRDPAPHALMATLNAAQVPFAFALSQTLRAKVTDAAARILAQHGRVAPVNIAQRVSYAETGATGQGVTEATDNKAGTEMAAIWDYVKGILNG